VVPLGGRPFIEYQIEPLCSHGIRDPIICVGRLGYLIEEDLAMGSPEQRESSRTSNRCWRMCSSSIGIRAARRPNRPSREGTIPGLLSFPSEQELRERVPDHYEQLRI
jgi:NDP-sugar pyrophosphorylase family protein